MPSLDPEDSGSSRENRLALVAVIASALVFSTSPVVIKVILRYTGPLTAGGLRFLIASLFLFSWLRRQRSHVPKLTRSNWFSFFLIGLCIATASGALFFALVTLSPTTASLAFCLTPIATLVFGIVWLKEHPSPIQLSASRAGPSDCWKLHFLFAQMGSWSRVSNRPSHPVHLCRHCKRCDSPRDSASSTGKQPCFNRIPNGDRRYPSLQHRIGL